MLIMMLIMVLGHDLVGQCLVAHDAEERSDEQHLHDDGDDDDDEDYCEEC